jgi:phosphotransferase system HPr (HPr) family protein
MRNRKVVVQDEHGMHARVALKILEKSKALNSKVTICNGCTKADGCSILELLLLGAQQGTELELVVNGGDEEKNIELIADLFTDGSGI